jgi:hypothetical protein
LYSSKDELLVLPAQCNAMHTCNTHSMNHITSSHHITSHQITPRTCQRRRRRIFDQMDG